MEIGSNLYHICEFAERMEYGGHTCEPVRDNLPERCYSVLSGSDEIIIIKCGEKGYFKTDIPVTDKDEARSMQDRRGKDYECLVAANKICYPYGRPQI